MSDDVRRRSACDRCHSQKLRCPKLPGAAVCNRCAKAKTACCYSPFRQKKEIIPDKGQDQASVPRANIAVPRDSSSFSSSPELEQLPGAKRRRADESFEKDVSDYFMNTNHDMQHDVSIDNVTLDFALPNPDFLSNMSDSSFSLSTNTTASTLDFQPFMSIYPEMNTKQVDLPFLDRPPVPENQIFAPQVQQSSWEQRSKDPVHNTTQHVPLALSWKFQEEALAMDTLGNCITRLSTLSVDLFTHRGTLPDFIDKVQGKLASVESYKEFRLDETFRVTQEVIDLYPTVMSNCFTEDPLVYNQQPNNLLFDAPKTAKTDHPTILLALSCHLRLIEIYESLFKHMGICTTMGMDACPSNFNAPVIKVGNFTPPPSSQIPLQMMLLVQMSSQLATYASEVLSRLKQSRKDESTSEDVGSGAEMDVLRLSLGSAESVHQRAQGMTLTLSDLRNQLLRQGLLA